DRRLYLFFGDLRARKGIWKVLSAAGRLAPEEASRICLAIVGHAEDAIERPMASLLATLGETSRLSIIRRAAFVPDNGMHEWFEPAEVVLAPYLNHTGSSGVLMLAAAHAVPVISQEFGQMGRVTRQHRLGLTVDPADAAALTDCLRRFIEGPPAEFDPE